MQRTFKMLALVWASSSSVALAQIGTEQVGTEDAPRAEQERAVEASSSPDNDYRGGFLNSGFQIRAGTDSSSAELTLARSTDERDVFGRTTVGVTFSVPIDKGSKEGALITEKGITGGFGAELAITSFIGTAKPPPVAKEGFVSQHRFLASLGAGFAINDYKYRDPLTFAASEVRRTSYQFSAALGWLPPDSATFFSAGLEYKRNYEAPDKRILCPPATGGAPAECTQAVFAPPERNTDNNLFGTIRTLNLFGLTGERSPVVLEIKAAYDVKDEVVGFEVPIYLLTDAEGKFRGGIRIGWDSEEEDTKIGFFIGVPFNFLGQ
jgi:hypothetical protein